jgi:hypothetical protein
MKRPKRCYAHNVAFVDLVAAKIRELAEGSTVQHMADCVEAEANDMGLVLNGKHKNKVGVHRMLHWLDMLGITVTPTFTERPADV